MLLLLQEEAPAFQLKIIVAHLNHQLRGAEADADETYVQRLAGKLGLPFHRERADIQALARQTGGSIEEAARQYRYAFLGRTAQVDGAKAVFVAHNADDQVETVLMHFLRGSGPAGLRGMLPTTPLAQLRLPLLETADKQIATDIQLYRPLLEHTRAEITAYLQKQNITPRFDRSNLDTTYYRNRLRHELLPYLKTYNPQISNAIQQMSRTIQADFELLTAASREAWQAVCQAGDESVVTFSLTRWKTLHMALQRSLLRQAAWQLRRQLRDFDFQAVERARQFITAPRSHVGQQIALPGQLTLTLGYDSFTLHDAAITPPATGPQLHKDHLAVTVPGDTQLPGTNWWLCAKIVDQDMLPDNWPTGRWQAWLDADKIREPLQLRRRQPGDRFAPLGLGGHHVKVNEFMINRKVPRWDRGKWPLLGSGDEIVWIPGLGAGETARVTAKSHRLLHLRLLQETVAPLPQAK